MRGRRTFWEQAIFASFSVLAQEPAIAKVVVALNELDAVSAPETQLVGAAGDKLVCGAMSVDGSSMNGSGRRRDLRTTTRVSPGRQPSVWERWAMGAAALEAWLERGGCAMQKAGLVVMGCSGGSHPSVDMLHEGIL